VTKVQKNGLLEDERAVFLYQKQDLLD